MGECLFVANRTLTISSEYPDSNKNIETIECGFDGKNIYRSYIYFDLSPLPYNAFITSAKMQLFLLEDYLKCLSKNIYVYMLQEDFGDYTTYNQQPRYSINYIKTNISYKNFGVIEIPITNFVIKWTNGEVINKGLLIRCEENKKSLVEFGSSKNTTYNYIPKLYLNFTQPTNQCEILHKLIEVKELEFNFYFSDFVQTPAIDVSKLIVGSFFIQNTGIKEIDVWVEVSFDGLNWVKDTNKKVGFSSTEVLIAKYYGKYYRIVINTNGAATAKIKFIYQTYI